MTKIGTALEDGNELTLTLERLTMNSKMFENNRRFRQTLPYPNNNHLDNWKEQKNRIRQEFSLVSTNETETRPLEFR